MFGNVMVRRVLLARGASLSTNNGLGRAHYSIESILNHALVPNWTKSSVVEHDNTSNIFIRLLNRWIKHPKKVTLEASKDGIDLLHITDQEQAHLVPYKSNIPVAVTIHDFFHIRPRTIEAGDVYVSVGDNKPNYIRKRDLKKLKLGLLRADILICISEETKLEAEKLFPSKNTFLVRNDVDVDYWNPYKNPISRDIISDFDDESKCLVITVGTNAPRKRLNFIKEVFSISKSAKILISGIAFKGVPQTNDLRGSSAIKILEGLTEHASQITIHDFINCIKNSAYYS